jgi:dienelactone hydrolase
MNGRCPPNDPRRRDFLLTSGAWLTASCCCFGQSPAARKDVPWLSEVQQLSGQIPADVPKLSSLLKDASGQKITTLKQWLLQRKRYRTRWLNYLKPLSAGPRKLPEVKVLSEDRVGGVRRQLIRYQVESNQPVEAYLLKPARVTSPVPGVAVFHSTVNHSIRQPAGVEGKPEKAFGLKLAQEGMVTICPRNYLWPTNHKIAAQAEADHFHQRHPGHQGMARMLLDAQIAIDLLVSQKEVDPQRLGAVGHSLGAKEVLYLAAFDERVKATVSSEGGIGTRYSNWDAPWYLGPQIKTSFPYEHHEVLALVAPRAFLLIGGDSADGNRSWPFIEKTLPVYRLYPGRPRLGLYNHRQGHSVPPESERRIYQWLKTYLR